MSHRAVGGGGVWLMIKEMHVRYRMLQSEGNEVLLLIVKEGQKVFSMGI